MAENITPVQLQIDGFEDREVILVDYKFNQATDIEGQIAGNPRGGRITVRVKALNDGNNQLLAWKLNPTDPRNVKINFSNTIDGKAMKTLEGNTCYCAHYLEKWEDGVCHYEEIEIVCKVLKNGAVTFENPWR